MSIYTDSSAHAPHAAAQPHRHGPQATSLHRIIPPLLPALTALSAAADQAPQPDDSNHHVIMLDSLVVEARAETQDAALIESRALKLHKIVDLAEVLSGELVEASIVRKSAYGNEVNLRGFSQANLPILVNGGFLEGACGSRKDPALSHINLLTVDHIVVREGPYDVTRPGNLGEPSRGSGFRF